MSDFKAKMDQILLPLRLHPRPCWRSLQLYLRGLLQGDGVGKGRGGSEGVGMERRGRNGKGRGRR